MTRINEHLIPPLDDENTGLDAPFRSYALDRAGNPRVHIRLVENTQRLYPPHKHDYFQMLYFMTEAPPLRIGLTSLKPVPGSVYFVAPMVAHQTRFDRDTRCVVLYFDLDFLRPGIARSYPITELVRLVPELTPFAWQSQIAFNLGPELTEKVERSVNSMIRHYESSGTFAREIIRAELALMLATICEGYEDEFAALAARLPVVGRDMDHMRRISAFIGDNYTRGPGLDEAARAVHLSKSRLCALIRRYTGTTFNVLIREMRIEDARERLMLTNDSIGRIAYAVGYGDEKYFLRAFKNSVGMTPGAYRLSEAKARLARGERACAIWRDTEGASR